MPELSRKDRDFVDISLAFEPNPITNDLTLLVDDRAINNAIKNAIMIAPKEAPFNPDFGSNINNMIFELADDDTAVLLEQEIKRTVLYNEPRVTDLLVSVVSQPGQNSIRATIQYNIVGYDKLVVFDQILSPTH
jgi:phage baseplate assembly protein W